MKKNYITNFIVACLFLSVKLTAQMNGNYTINNAVPTGGTNFQTFSAFASQLVTSGINAPVTVNVANGTFVEQVVIPAYAGASAINTITINGNGSTITFNSTNSAQPNTLLLSGADYMYFNNLNIVGSGPTYAIACHLFNNSDYNYFTNCQFRVPFLNIQTSQTALAVSGLSTSATSSGLSGNYNTFDGCLMIGGYYGTAFYGNTVAPFTFGNTIKNSKLQDWYVYGLYHAYSQNTVLKNNIVERINSTQFTTTYGFLMTTGSQGSIIDGNWIRKLFPTNGINATCYCIYFPVAGALAQRNVIINNLVSDINQLGQTIGIYCSGASFTDVYHNTISLDDNINVSASVCYGVYMTGANSRVKNNIVTLQKAGTATKVSYYYTGATNLQSDYNVSYINAPGTNYAVQMTANYSTLSLFNATNPAYDSGSKDADPVYTNTASLNYVPTSTVINNMCPNVGVLTDLNQFPRSLASPDPGAYECYTVQCVNSPPANSVLTPTGIVCQNSNVFVGLVNTFTNTGYNIQWQSATASILGPFTAIPGATLPIFNTNTLTTTTYFNALVYCVNGGATITVNAGGVQVATPIINNVPYLENFEGIAKPNQLPNCSWAATSSYTSTLTYTTLNTNNRIPHSGTKFASFYNTPGGQNAFYSNGINLVTGITYSAGLYYINELVGYNNWSDFSILVGQSQSANGQTSIASTTASAVSYSLLSGTFTVPVSGVYYIAVRATTGSGNSPYLTWDDLFVTIPCSLNSPNMALNPSTTGVCSGDKVYFNATGANTYTWNTGSNSPQAFFTPSINTTYTLTGTNSLSGCTTSLTQFIAVNPSPPVSVFASSMVICQGQTTNLSAQGANTYNWSTGVAGQNISVTPNGTTSYSVIGVGLNGCSTMQNIVITVNPQPQITASPNSTMLCKGDVATFIGNGAATYQWASTASLIQFGNPLNTVVQSSGAYTVTGTDVNGCTGSTFFVLDVEECTGINELLNSTSGISVHPNPNNGEFFIESKKSDIKAIEIYDVTGRIVYSGAIADSNTKVNIGEMPNGVYSIKVKTGEAVKYIKIVKAQ